MKKIYNKINLFRPYLMKVNKVNLSTVKSFFEFYINLGHVYHVIEFDEQFNQIIDATWLFREGLDDHSFSKQINMHTVKKTLDITYKILYSRGTSSNK